MARPAGYSSDEDDYDSFGEDDFDEPPFIQRNLNPEEEHEQRLDSLFFAIMRDDLETVNQLLDEGLDITVTVRDNWNLIMLAASTGAVAIVQELINRGADVSCNRDKYTTLMAACSCPSSTAPYEKSAQIAKLLVEHGADVNAISRKRMTPLMYAASNGNVEIVQQLLPLCDKDAEDNQGWTALFWAVNDNHAEVVKVLLEAGLNPEKNDIRSNSLLHYATMNDADDIKELLPTKQQIQTVEDVFKNSSYNFEEEFENLKENERPIFFRDVCVMLYGMRCEQLINIFSKRNVDLLTFVTLNEKKLQDLDVILPYQRKKVMIGLYKFHKYPYRAKSIPIVSKNEIYSTIDFSNALISAVRQITTMEGAVVYMKSQISEPLFDKQIENSIVQIQTKLKSVKRLSNMLLKKAKEWDQMTSSADLITKNSLKKRKLYKRWILFFGILTVSFFISKRSVFN
ncbi:ankyrin repeat, SAM and basic leucine zipper domain-containing protein 1-like [Agrilus planipennis]|uniref:Ankyrin repeat, SAM and basic leucine zipper domain-containing protein 1-like n=1 Tax=Agrilus planipennis TaxID=224129 RepID=A0A1W4WPV2_AGRPL|nr:ankyrin repeat, SAM and basic leucine zipper domain-containing protein 1-like [Agrilus planipennis]